MAEKNSRYGEPLSVATHNLGTTFSGCITGAYLIIYLLAFIFIVVAGFLLILKGVVDTVAITDLLKDVANTNNSQNISLSITQTGVSIDCTPQMIAIVASYLSGTALLIFSLRFFSATLK